MPISSFHTARLLASIAQRDVVHRDTLTEDERDAGSEESGKESLHMSSDESDTEERIETRRERRRDFAVEPTSLTTSSSTSLPFRFRVIYRVPSTDPIAFDAELAAARTEPRVLLTRYDADHDRLLAQR